MDYGTGAIFGCPAHDQRDLDFANKYKLKVLPVVRPKNIDPKKFVIENEAYTQDGILFNSNFLNNLAVDQAIEKIIKVITKKKIGKKKITFRLKDWGVSRQRYWGCPIPILYNSKGKPLPVKKKIYLYCCPMMLILIQKEILWKIILLGNLQNFLQEKKW